MKTFPLIVGSIVVLALAVLSFSERRENEKLRLETAQLKEMAVKQIAASQEQAAKFQKQIEDRTSVIAQMEEQRKRAASNATEAKEVTAEQNAQPVPVASDLRSMMKNRYTDPEMRKATRIGMMSAVKTMYANLAKELGLKPDHANLLMDLLTDRQMAQATEAWQKTGEARDNSSIAVIAEQIESAKLTTKEYDAQLESLLGAEGMAKMREYRMTVMDQRQIKEYQKTFFTDGVPLTDSESTGLLAIMKEERLRKIISFNPQNARPAARTMPSQDELTQRFVAQEAAIEKRVLDRARNVLSPDHLEHLSAIQKQQREMREASNQLSRRDENQK